MIKIFTRTLIILSVAELVAGGIYLVANNTSTLNIEGDGSAPRDGPGAGGGNQFYREGRESNSFNSMSFLSILLNLVNIAVVTIAVVMT